MIDPILKAIQGAIVSIGLSDPETGVRLARLKPEPSMDIRTALKADGAVLHYNREHVKSLTIAELKEAMASAVG